MGTLIVGAAVAAVAALAVRSIVKGHKKSGCEGDCTQCRGGGCH